MKITILTLFPEAIWPLLNFSILKRAQDKKIVEFEVINIRDFGIGKHKVVDGKPYGGGVGMLLRADVLGEAVKSISKIKKQRSKIILTSAGGYPFNQRKARELTFLDHLTLVCGHYEGVDQRFVEKYVDEEITIGDFVLTGGEMPAVMITDSIVRLLPGVLEKEEATLLESFEDNLLEHAQYTRPGVFEGMDVPRVLKSGNHGLIKQWKKDRSILKTKKIRPDLSPK